jgi:hypothetical protein
MLVLIDDKLYEVESRREHSGTGWFPCKVIDNGKVIAEHQLPGWLITELSEKQVKFRVNGHTYSSIGIEATEIKEYVRKAINAMSLEQLKDLKEYLIEYENHLGTIGE